MQLSKHNIFSQIKDSDNYYLINTLSGNADILSADEAEQFKNKQFANEAEFIEKGYLVNPQEEEKLFRKKYLDFIDDRDEDEVQLFFTPWYTCNFNCSYCFQDEYTNTNDNVEDEVIDAFFAYVDEYFVDRKKYITIFGGEPFLNTPSKKASIKKVIDGANARNLDIAVVTNGYHIIDFIDIIKTAKVREIQVTVDGTADVHDKRRMLKGGSGSFQQIVDGVNQLLANNIPVNMRMIVDKDNVHNLPDLARFAIAQGWTNSLLFKTALGRNYELHHCQTNNSRLFQRLEMYQEIYNIIKDNPEVLEFHKPAFSIAKFIFENGDMPSPLFDSCSGTKTEWAFDYTGRIYSCTATVGNIGDELGKFHPTIELKDDLIEEWEERDVFSIKECQSCAVRLACGGGCAAIAKSRTGSILSPDCRPIEGLLELGIGLYSELEI